MSHGTEPSLLEALGPCPTEVELEALLFVLEQTEKCRGKYLVLLRRVAKELQDLIQRWEHGQYLGEELELEILDWMMGALDKAVRYTVESEEEKREFINTSIAEFLEKHNRD